MIPFKASRTISPEDASAARPGRESSHRLKLSPSATLSRFRAKLRGRSRPKPVRVPQRLDVERGLAGIVVELALEPVQGGDEDFAPEQAGPEEDGAGGIGRFDRVGGQDAE